ncbi:13278_t:CDS:2 [Dentiscutata heterogama]|uniref:13278_t:CDS:1 n=1 Tax=Dentiscutata heterogama TaxID=1316150 RepID=A0ACA9K990_9GLOM|nr:13278_t:CDS:2 [Dentiscutata heterogama]
MNIHNNLKDESKTNDCNDDDIEELSEDDANEDARLFDMAKYLDSTSELEFKEILV